MNWRESPKWGIMIGLLGLLGIMIVFFLIYLALTMSCLLAGVHWWECVE